VSLVTALSVTTELLKRLYYMNLSIKSLSRVAFVAAAIAIGSCAPTGPSSPENDLAITEKTLTLSSAILADTSDVTLVCTCPFDLTVVSYTGDTNAITYTIPMLGQTVSQFRVIMKGETTATTGTYTSQLVLKGGGEGYLDTITTTYVVQ
jgi:hypothetical protein